MKSYKTKGNLEEGRRRREEEGLQLRKLKREEQVSLLINNTLIPLATVGSKFAVARDDYEKLCFISWGSRARQTSRTILDQDQGIKDFI